MACLLLAGPGLWSAALASPSLHALAPTHAQVIVTDSESPPAADDPRWQRRPLAQDEPGPSAWYRLRFDAPAPGTPADGPLMLYLPYFYGGGRVLLNGGLVAELPRTTAAQRVRWERPLLLPVAALQARGNELLVHAHAEYQGTATSLPRLVLGPQHLLQPMFERRLFFVRTLPVVTWVAGSVVGLLVLFIWLQRRDEVDYGLFGLAALLWAQRTSTFVLEVLPAGTWDLWRAVYHLCTGGFVVVMALFVLNMAGWGRRGLTRALLAYAALGPLAYLAWGEGAARVWTAGLLPVGLGILVVAIAATWRRRSAETVAVAAAVVASVLAGVHDQLVATRSPLIMDRLPEWGDHHLFLLHHAANVLLLVMGVLLALRFVRSLNAVELANRTLEARVQQREREIAASYQRIAALQREQAATDERQRIMRDLHDGLGSQLFTSLSRAERGAMDSGAMADTLRGAIDQMRVAVEALASEEQDFQAAFGNFRFRWDARLRESGLTPRWDIVIPDSGADGVSPLAPHDALQLLHIIQEALTNVLKHARASTVTVRVALVDAELAVEVADDGAGIADTGPVPTAAGDTRHGGRGRANMRNRAQRLGGQLEWQSLGPGTCVRLRAPWQRPAATGGAACDG
ncbi:sensor histidine kinase [Rubrivivax sp. RP6-9]|uniref:sensor histidine kinase n=1 Tax=Rubrivivax sp. RP6-9 TaxID=3415750 RepID=UPI003CC51400